MKNKCNFSCWSPQEPLHILKMWVCLGFFWQPINILLINMSCFDL